jgi:hypothetical protein
MDTPIQVGTGTDGTICYSVLLVSATDPAGIWSAAKPFTFSLDYRDIGSDTITGSYPFLGLAGHYVQLGGGQDWAQTGDMAGTLDSNAATYEAWIKTSSKQQQRILLGWVGTGGALPRLAVEADKLSVYWGPGGTGGPAVYSTDTTPITDGRWHHVAFVCDRGQARFYKDGGATKDANLVIPTVQTGSITLQIGPSLGTAASFDGQIAEVRGPA